MESRQNNTPGTSEAAPADKAPDFEFERGYAAAKADCEPLLQKAETMTAVLARKANNNCRACYYEGFSRGVTFCTILLLLAIVASATLNMHVSK